MNRKSICLLIIGLLLFTHISAQQKHNLKGVVTDKQSGETIVGAVIQLLETEMYAVTGLDGSYVIKNVPTGQYKIRISFMTYSTVEEDMDILSNRQFDVQMLTDAIDLKGVTISASAEISSEVSARLTEKNVMNVISVISSKEIDVSPDITVANVMQRVSGVSLERNSNGDGQYAIVRGMDKRYNYTLVNGVKIPSPDPRNRYVPLDIFPSDLLDRLEVTKALIPNMEGDAIGGVVDMKMKNAPDRFTVNANVGTGYSQMFFDEDFRYFDRSSTLRKSPRVANGKNYQAKVEDFQRKNIDFKEKAAPLNQIYSLSLGNRFFNKKLGVLVAGSYQNTYRGANSMFISTFVNQDNNTPYYEIVQLRKFSTQQVRLGLHTKLDYIINERSKINLYLAGIALNDFETRTRTDTILLIGRGQGPGTGRIELRERSRQRYQNIYNATLQGEHRFWAEKLKADWSMVYSLATNDDPDMAELMWLTALSKDNQGQFKQDPIQYGTDYKRRWITNKDQDVAGYLNLSYFAKIAGNSLALSGGGMYRTKNRQSRHDEYLLRTMPIMQEWSGSIYDASWNLFNTIGTPTDPLNYISDEQVMGLYGMAKLDLNRLSILAGARYEATRFGWESNAPSTVSGRKGSISYDDLLPSVYLKYMPNEKQNIRLAWFSSISRPSFLEVIPYSNKEDDFSERGNPYLKRTKAQNIDLRYERFQNYLDKIMLGVFYKKIKDPIESALQIELQQVFLLPNNFGTAQNMGLEFDFTKYFRNFGIRMFYTYTKSEITTSKLVRFRDEDGNLTSRTENQTRPLQGQSSHISNVSLLYKNPRIGTDVQLAMVYTGRRIMSVSPYLDNDIWQRSFVQLDLSVEQKVYKNFTMYVKLNNILNAPMRADILLPNTFNPEQAPYLDASKRVLVREDFYRQTYLIGIKYRFVEK